MRSLISLRDLDTRDVAMMVDRAVNIGRGAAVPASLSGRAVGILFAVSSTRTRTAFWRAATRLGADVAVFGPDDLQLRTGESIEDTARVMSGYLDLLVARTNGDLREMRALAEAADLGVVNALTEYEHPTQALADLALLTEEFGTLNGRHVLYIGEGNATAVSLAHATALTPGLALTILTPENYGLPDSALAGLPGSDRIHPVHSIDEADRVVDAVYTSRWQQMGAAKPDLNWLAAFAPYQVDAKLFDRFSKEGAVFLHDLPAVRGQEVTAEVLDGPRSRAFRQAFHKYTAATAVLDWCAGG